MYVRMHRSSTGPETPRLLTLLRWSFPSASRFLWQRLQREYTDVENGHLAVAEWSSYRPYTVGKGRG